MEVHQRTAEPWNVTWLILVALTGGRLKRVASYPIKKVFCFTYGDGLSDVDIRALINFHQETASLLPLHHSRWRYGAINGWRLNY